MSPKMPPDILLIMQVLADRASPPWCLRAGPQSWCLLISEMTVHSLVLLLVTAHGSSGGSEARTSRLCCLPLSCSLAASTERVPAANAATDRERPACSSCSLLMAREVTCSASSRECETAAIGQKSGAGGQQHFPVAKDSVFSTIAGSSCLELLGCYCL